MNPRHVGAPLAWSDGRVLRALNPRAMRLLGADERGCEEVFPASQHAAWRRLLQRSLRAGTSVERLLQLIRSSGDERSVRVCVSPASDSGFLVTFEDRSEAHAALAESGRSSRFLRELLDQTPTIFFVVDRSGAVVFRNRSFDLLAGKELQTVSETSLPQLTPAFHAALAGLFDDGEERHLQVVSSGVLDSERRLRFELQPLEDAAGAVHQALVTGYDLTDLLSAHAEQRRLQGELEQARRLEALGQMAGTIAHDFNNFLTVMQSSSMLLRELLPGRGPEVESVLDSLAQVTAQARGLTQDLVAFSRSQVHSLRSSSVDSLLGSLQAALPRLIPAGMDFALHLPQLPPAPAATVSLSESQCLQVFVNLVQNAVEATGAGGRVEVSVELGRDGLQVRVADDGPGVPPAVAVRIFEPFYTTRGDAGGTGLGLSSARSLLARAGGGIELERGALGGACFRVWLPVRST